MKKIVITIFFLIHGLFYTQVGNENVSFSTGNFFLRGGRPSTKEYIVDGSPYINGKEFDKVIIAGYSKNVQDLRYNAYEDEMEFKQGDDIYATNKEDGIKIEFPTLKKTYLCTNYPLDSKNKLGYLAVLAEGPTYSLYKVERVELLKGEKSPNAYSKDANDYFAKQKDVFLVRRNKSFIRVAKNQKDILEQFSVDQQEFQKAMGGSKFNLSKEADLIKFINFLNSK